MGKYIKKFDTHSNYEDFIQTEDFIIPNVSLCVAENELHYSNSSNVIIYKAHSKISSPYSLKSGCFGEVNMIAHEFIPNANPYDLGTGIIICDGPITEITNYAFYSAQINEIILPARVEIIDQMSVENNSFTKLVIPKSVTSIGAAAFHNNSTTLTTLIVNPTTPPTLGQYAFGPSNIVSTLSIYVPDESVETYKAASGWSALYTIIKPISEYVES